MYEPSNAIDFLRMLFSIACSGIGSAAAFAYRFLRCFLERLHESGCQSISPITTTVRFLFEITKIRRVENLVPALQCLSTRARIFQGRLQPLYCVRQFIAQEFCFWIFVTLSNSVIRRNRMLYD